MMSIAKITANNRDYLMHDDAMKKGVDLGKYYGEGEGGKLLAGRDKWYGNGAKRYQLQGQISAAQLDTLYAAIEAKGRSVYGYDLTFSSDKSISVVAAMPEHRAAMLAAHDKAVREAVKWAYRQGWVRAHLKSGDVALAERDICAALCNHYTSRPSDATGESELDVHTHCMIPNAVKIERDGKTVDVAVNAGDLYKHQKDIGRYFRQVEARELMRMGYAVESVGDPAEGLIQLADFTPELRDRYSGRKRDIEDALAAQGKDAAALDYLDKQKGAVRDTRHAKDPHYNLADKMRRVAAELAEAGWSPKKANTRSSWQG